MTPVLWTERVSIDESTAQQLAEAVSGAFGLLQHARDILDHWSKLDHRPGLELALLYNTGLTHTPECIERVEKALRNGGSILQPWEPMGGDPIGLGVSPKTIALRGVADDGDCVVTMANLRGEREWLRWRTFGLTQNNH